MQANNNSLPPIAGSDSSIATELPQRSSLQVRIARGPHDVFIWAVGDAQPLERLLRDALTVRHHGFVSESKYETVRHVYVGAPPEFRESQRDQEARANAR